MFGVIILLVRGDVNNVAGAAKLVGQYVGRASGFATRLRMQADEMMNSARSVNPELRASTSALQAKLGQLRAVSYQTRSTVSVRDFWQSHASSYGVGGSPTQAQSSSFTPGSPMGAAGWPTSTAAGGQPSSVASAAAAAAFASFSGVDSSIAGSFMPSIAPAQSYQPVGQPGIDAGSSMPFAPAYGAAAGAGVAAPSGSMPPAPFAMPSFPAFGSAMSGMGGMGMSGGMGSSGSGSGVSAGVGGVPPGVSGGSLAEACLVREALLRHYMTTQGAGGGGGGAAGGAAPARSGTQPATTATSAAANLPPPQPQLK